MSEMPGGGDTSANRRAHKSETGVSEIRPGQKRILDFDKNAPNIGGERVLDLDKGGPIIWTQRAHYLVKIASRIWAKT